MQRLMATSWRLARQNIEKAQAVQRVYYNRNAQDFYLQPGDMVYNYVPAQKKGQAAKFLHPWHGPYQVVEVREPIVKIETMTKKKRLHAEWVHINMVKPVNTTTATVNDKSKTSKTSLVDFESPECFPTQSIGTWLLANHESSYVFMYINCI